MGSATDPVGEAYSAPPDPVAGFKGPTSKGGNGAGKGKRKGRGWDVRFFPDPTWQPYFYTIHDSVEKRELHCIEVGQSVH